MALFKLVLQSLLCEVAVCGKIAAVRLKPSYLVVKQVSERGWIEE